MKGTQIINLTCVSSLPFLAGNPNNRQKIGMVENAPMGGNYFYNDFITDLLQNPGTATPDKEEQRDEYLVDECLSILERIAFVEIEMSTTDALVYTKIEATPIDPLTGVGGLLSLYMGASFLSLVEVLVVIPWLMIFMLKKVTHFNG